MINNRQEALDKAAKLLALSSSSNQHEASIAAERAQDIMLRFNLTERELQQHMAGTKSEYTVEHVYNVSNRNWQRFLRSAVATGHLCKYLMYNGTNHGLLVGKPHNIQAANFLYDYLSRQLDRLANENYASMAPWGANKRQWRNSFLMGAALAIDTRMRKHLKDFQAETEETMALVVSSDSELAEAIARLVGETKKNGPAVRVQHGQAYSAGYDAGKSIQFRQGIEDNSKTPKLQ